MTTDLDHAIRSALADVVATAPHDDGEPLRTITPHPPTLDRRPLLAVAAVVALFGTIATIAALRTPDTHLPPASQSSPVPSEPVDIGLPVDTQPLPTVDPNATSRVVEGAQQVSISPNGDGTFSFGLPEGNRGSLTVAVDGAIYTLLDSRGQTQSGGSITTAVNLAPFDTSSPGETLVAHGAYVITSDPSVTTLTATSTDGTSYTTELVAVPGDHTLRFAMISIPNGTLTSAKATDRDGNILASF